MAYFFSSVLVPWTFVTCVSSQLCWACHVLPHNKKVTGPTQWGNGYFFRNFWCVAIQEVKVDDLERPCNGASTGFCFRTLPTKWRGAINRTSSFSLKKKIPKTQRFNNLPILKKTAQNSICMRTATSYGHNIAKKNRGSSITFPEIYSFFPFFGKNEYLDQHVTNLAPVKKWVYESCSWAESFSS